MKPTSIMTRHLIFFWAHILLEDRERYFRLAIDAHYTDPEHTLDMSAYSGSRSLCTASASREHIEALWECSADRNGDVRGSGDIAVLNWRAEPHLSKSRRIVESRTWASRNSATPWSERI